MNFQGRLGVICGGRASFVTDGRRVGRMDLVSSRKSLPLANKVGKLMFHRCLSVILFRGGGRHTAPLLRFQTWNLSIPTCPLETCLLEDLLPPPPPLVLTTDILWWLLKHVRLGSRRYASYWNAVFIGFCFLPNSTGSILFSTVEDIIHTDS